ncbi:MAG: nitrous oxide-stimulated promoter family protein [Dysgonomonas sp.]
MNATEKRTVGKMIHLYCHAKHGTRHTLCATCTELNEYAQKRLSKCVYGNEKPTCKKCPVHCYAPSMKAKIKEVMHYAGPRMLFRSPLLAVIHVFSELKKSAVK